MTTEDKIKKAKELVHELSKLTTDLQNTCHLIKVNTGLRGDIKLDIYKSI